MATFKARHPQVQVGEPVVQVDKAGYWTTVQLPADDWTFELALAKGELHDDNYAKYEAVVAARSWLQRARATHKPIHPNSVHRAASGGFDVYVDVTDPHPDTWTLTVSNGQVIEFRPPDLALASAPVSGARAAELIARNLKAQWVEVKWALERPDGAWEYGFVEASNRYGYALVENGELKSVSSSVPDVLWLPPH